MRFPLPAARLKMAALLLSGFAVFGSLPSAPAQSKVAPGLQVTYTLADGNASDVTVSPNVWLYVPAGKPVSPFLPAAPFTAAWEGFITVDLRDRYTFMAELNGRVTVEINGAPALEAESQGGATEPGRPMRLNRGENAIKVHFTAPLEGDAFLRLLWSSPDIPQEPIPVGSLTHAMEQPELQARAQLRLGRELVIEYQCLKCHVSEAPSAVPDLASDAPAFHEIGSRRNHEWLARWILDPPAERSAARMPRLLHGAQSKTDADAMAAYLSSLKSAPAAYREPDASLAEAGKELFRALHCGACHNDPASTETDGSKISLAQVRRKFTPGALAPFLQKPEAHYAWTRMPNFQLTGEEASALAAFLNSVADRAGEGTPAAAEEIIEKGRQLIQTTGCLNCHALELENRFSTKPLAQLPVARWKHGCVADLPPPDSTAPQFALNAEQKSALRAFAASDRTSLARHVPAEFAARQLRALNCAGCHGQFEGFPPLPGLGGKLKPEWSRALMAGEVAYKPRPWLEARMPAFASVAEPLARGLAMQHGYPPQTPVEAPVDPAAAELGRSMIGSDGGFSCVACHAIRDFGAAVGQESPGINLVHSAERLLYPFYHRWMLNPLRLEPQTKMPVYFDQGRSPLPEPYAGDASRQIEAIWQYLRLGDQMPLPKDAEVQP